MEKGNPWIFSLLHCLLLLLLHPAAASSLPSDTETLLAFRAAADAGGRLTTWNLSSAPCAAWRGVGCFNGRVTRLVLESLSLSGAGGLRLIVGDLDQLRILSVKDNLLSGSIPDLSHLTALKLLFLSRNLLSGEIPPSIAAVDRLYRLDLSHNNLSGAVPAADINKLRHLLTLRLDSNRLSGPISALFLPNLQDLNLSSNSLSGAIPHSLSSFPASAFSGNPSICGSPFPICSDLASDPAVSPAIAVVSSSPTSKPEVASTDDRRRSGGGISRVSIVAIVAGDFAVLVIVSGLLFCYFWRKFAAKTPTRLQEGEKIVYSSSPYGNVGAADGFERGKMLFLEGTKRFELEDLLRASAEMLGKGGYGTAYKAVLDDGSVVAVKRLREVQISGKREFETYIEALGRLQHPNIVPLKAYYYARDEKLLVYDFMPNGSLFSLLHGNRGPGRTPLDWSARMRIATGTARGLAFIHQKRRAHGNVKSTNILLNKSGNPCLADVGLAMLGPALARGSGYRAPETPTDGKRVWATKEADVYALGVLLLEMLTGRPADGGGTNGDLRPWVASVVREEWTAEVFDIELMRYKGIEEEMVGMLQVAMACSALGPDQRPAMSRVVKMIDDVRGSGGEVEMLLSPSHHSFESVSDSPSVSEDAGSGRS